MTVPAVLALPLLLTLSGRAAFFDALNIPGYWKSVTVALISSSLGTVLAIVLALALLASISGHRGRWLRLAMPPLLATPHAAMAVGLAFLVAPSGWFYA